jgi:hypothetical protein
MEYWMFNIVTKRIVFGTKPIKYGTKTIYFGTFDFIWEH